MNMQTIQQEAMQLPEKDRAELAHNLLLSLETLSEAEISAQWRHEAKRRAADLDKEVAAPIAADVVRAAAKALLR